MSIAESHPDRFVPDELVYTPETIQQMLDQNIARTAKYCYERSAFYRHAFDQAGMKPEDLCTVEALKHFPPTTKSDVSSEGAAFWCRPQSDIVDIPTTSGTTGRPTLYPMTERDIQRLALNERLSFTTAGLTREDTVILAVTIDRCFIAGLAYYEGLRCLGATAVRVGSGTPALLINMIKTLKPTAIVSVPSFLKVIANYAADQNVELTDSSVSKLVCIGEPIRDEKFQLNPLGEWLAEKWNAELFSTYGVTELATSFCECGEGRGGHSHPDLLHVEVLDDLGRQVPDGEVGEIVATTFGVEAMPLIRFRTGDCSFIDRSRCRCGRWTPRVGPILGRKNQMLKIKGTTIFPSAVERVLQSFPQIDDYVMVASSLAPLSDTLEVLVATSASIDGPLLEKLQGELKVKPTIRVESVETIEKLRNPGASRKKVTFIDRRGA